MALAQIPVGAAPMFQIECDGVKPRGSNAVQVAKQEDNVGGTTNKHQGSVQPPYEMLRGASINEKPAAGRTGENQNNQGCYKTIVPSCSSDLWLFFKKGGAMGKTRHPML